MDPFVKSISIVCTFDNNYSQHCGVLLASLFENNKNICFDIYIVSDFIDDVNKSRPFALVRDYSQRLYYIQIDKKKFEGLPFGGKFSHISLATYYRLMLPEVLPVTLDKILYLDCDIIVNGRIESLWNIDLKYYTIGAVEDNIVISSEAPRRLGYPVQSSYFNAGVMLMNLSLMRDIQFTKNAFVYIEQHLKEIVYHDQDILNVLLYDQKLFLPIKWNVMECFLFRRPLIHFRYKKELREAQIAPSIIHFTGKLKPWIKECDHPYRDLYYKYLYITEWRNYVPQDKYVRRSQKILFDIKKMIQYVLDKMFLKSYLYDQSIKLDNK